LIKISESEAFCMDLKFQISNSKSQTNHKHQIPNSAKTGLEFVNWNLFGIWDLLFGILARKAKRPRKKVLPRAALLLALLLQFGCAATRPPARTPVVAPEQPAVVGRQTLARALETILADSVLQRTNVGVKVLRASDGSVLFEHNAQKLFHPASNTKLFTSAAALHYLGPDFRFTTRVAIDSATVLADTLRGNIYLIGSGNPDFSLGDLAYLVEQLYAAGVRHITGEVICDDFYLDDLRQGAGWMWDEGSSTDFARLSALTVADNCIDVTARPAAKPGQPARIELLPATGFVQVINHSVTVDSALLAAMQQDSLAVPEPLRIERRWRQGQNIIDLTGVLPIGAEPVQETLNLDHPSLYFGTLFKEYCQRQGIGIDGGVVRGLAPANLRVLARHESEPLSSIITNMNKPSDNLSAELLLKTVGAETRGRPGTAKKGIRALREMLGAWGVDTTAMRFVDGSGVSRYNLVSPEGIAALLRHMHRDFTVRSEYVASLPIAGVDGSLEHRMRHTAAFRMVRAKTGTLSGVTTLSGYTQARDGQVLVFSIMMAHYIGNSRPFRDVQDRICDVLARFQE